MHMFGRPRLKPPWGLSTPIQQSAEKAAADHPLDEHYLPELGATERDPEMHMLWQHCMRSQIAPQFLKRMKRNHLEYIAAHSGDVTYVVEERIHGDKTKPTQPQIVSGRNLKLQENAFRAKYELERRDRQKAALLTTLIAAAIGALAGGLFASGVWP